MNSLELEEHILVTQFYLISEKRCRREEVNQPLNKEIQKCNRF